MLVARRTHMTVADEGHPRRRECLVVLVMDNRAEHAGQWPVLVPPVRRLVREADVADHDLLAQAAQQRHGLRAQPTVRLGPQRDLALVVAVDADDAPLRQDQRAGVGLLRAVDEIP